MPTPKTYDLKAFANSLFRHRSTKPVANKLMRWLDVASCHADMLQAQELMHTIALEARGDVPSLPYSHSVRLALLSQAILLYARATVTGSARRSFDIRDRLTTAQKRAHEELTHLRNNAIAHFARETEHRGLKWAEETIVIDERLRMAVAIRRMALNQDIFALVAGQIEAAVQILDEMRIEKTAEAKEALWALMDSEPELGRKLAALQWNPDEFFSSPELAADFYGEGKGSGRLHNMSRLS